MRYSILWRAILWRADLRGADLRGTRLIGADLSRANLEGARHDEKTQWPEGFDPRPQGAVRDEGALGNYLKLSRPDLQVPD